MNINCPHCRQSIEAAEELAGSAASCPTCEGLFEVPEPAPSPGSPRSHANSHPAVPPQGAGGEAVFNPRVTGLKNLFWGGLLVAMGLTGWFGGSIFTGNADAIDTCFDLLGIFWILVGAVQVCLPKQVAGAGQEGTTAVPKGAASAGTGQGTHASQVVGATDPEKTRTELFGSPAMARTVPSGPSLAVEASKLPS